MTDAKTPSQEHAAEIERKNAEESRKLIEERKQRGQEQPVYDERDPGGPGAGERRQDAPPGQRDVPAGGTSGPNTGGGSTKRHKPN